VVLGAAVLAPPAAQADQTYRYWSYWTGGDLWSYSARGPGFRIPPDAGVEGWRFVVSPKDGSQASPPTAPATFSELCPTAGPAPEGQKRVALVLDFGAPGVAPVGEQTPPRAISCLTVANQATGLQVLQQAARLRFHSSGLICGIAGFPATECPGQTTRSASTPGPSSPTPVAPAPAAPVAPPAPALTAQTDPQEQSPRTPTPTPSVPRSPLEQPSPVALPLSGSTPPAAEPGTPPWIAAIGAAMIAALLGLALLARKGRE
jgi:hypothetical protein